MTYLLKHFSLPFFFYFFFVLIGIDCVSEIQDVVTAGLCAVSFSRRYYMLVGPYVSLVTLTKTKNN